MFLLVMTTVSYWMAVSTPNGKVRFNLQKVELGYKYLNISEQPHCIFDENHHTFTVEYMIHKVCLTYYDDKLTVYALFQ